MVKKPTHSSGRRNLRCLNEKTLLRFFFLRSQLRFVNVIPFVSKAEFQEARVYGGWPKGNTDTHSLHTAYLGSRTHNCAAS